jgi:hypothetical protein
MRVKGSKASLQYVQLPVAPSTATEMPALLREARETVCKLPMMEVNTRSSVSYAGSTTMTMSNSTPTMQTKQSPTIQPDQSNKQVRLLHCVATCTAVLQRVVLRCTMCSLQSPSLPPETPAALNFRRQHARHPVAAVHAHHCGVCSHFGRSPFPPWPVVS